MSTTPIIYNGKYRSSLTTPTIIEVNDQSNGYGITIPEKNKKIYKNSASIEPIIIEVDNQLNGYEITIPEKNKEIYKNSLSTDPIIIEMSGQGPQGMRGPQGKDGNGIERIEKTSTSGITDTYTIYFTNGAEFQYEIVNGVVYYYEGPYEVNPSNNSQSLSTANLVMRDNVNINGISYQETSNSSGGYTATIGN